MKLVKCCVHDIYPKWNDDELEFYCPLCKLDELAEFHDIRAAEWNEKNDLTVSQTMITCGRCGKSSWTDTVIGERAECPYCGFYTLKEE